MLFAEMRVSFLKASLPTMLRSVMLTERCGKLWKREMSTSLKSVVAMSCSFISFFTRAIILSLKNTGIITAVAMSKTMRIPSVMKTRFNNFPKFITFCVGVINDKNNIVVFNNENTFSLILNLCAGGGSKFAFWLIILTVVSVFEQRYGKDKECMLWGFYTAGGG